ncbi:hypothetical protein HanXRQr2_Chr01g0022641 [Helianthus annuus]|uniref:Uncharacterized protein n=1 Tax=Helianthus annuus TaxID=4232 RepID=A0A9K3JVY7_HELAN|nr:hypothetical protein HanXRQr2_Chr01g0022641 [Helianthus annuus]
MYKCLCSSLSYLLQIDFTLSARLYVQILNVCIPAVVVPSFLNDGFSFARSAIFVLGLIPSSTDIITGFSSPVFGSTIYKEIHLTFLGQV